MINRILIASILSLVVSYASQGQSGTSAIDTGDTTVLIHPEVIQAIDINDRIEEMLQLLTDISYDLEPDAEIQEIDSLLVDKYIFLRREAQNFREYNPYNLSKFFLENSYRAWEGYHQQLDDWSNVANNKLSLSKENISDLNFNMEEWILTLDMTIETGEPFEVQKRINDIIDEIDKVIGDFDQQAGELISLELEITDAILFTDEIIEEVSQLQENLRDSLFIAREPPLWQIAVSTRNWSYYQGRLNKMSAENSKIFKNYFQSLHLRFYLIIAVIMLVLVFRLRVRYFKLDLDEARPGCVNARRILLDNFYPTMGSLLIFLLIIMFPYNPLVFTSLLSLILLVCLRFVLEDFLGVNGRKVIWILVTLLVISQLEILMWYFGDWARIYIVLESSAVMLSALVFIRPAKRRIYLKESPFMRFVVRYGYIVFAFGLTAFVANISGYLDLAVLVLKIAVESSVLILIVYGLTKIFKVIAMSVSDLLRSTGHDTIIKRTDKIQYRVLNLINLCAVIYLVSSILTTLEIRRPVIDYLVRTLEHQWIFGTLTISLSGILMLVLILVLTFIISGFIKVIIEEEIAPRIRLPKGVPFAISVTIQYFIVILGFVLALSVAGIDLGEFGLIAGALGIGIGFGLQNIVANFISGLILIYERPVQSGDTVEVENLVGEVKKIGIRSSNVRTYDGAEVIVPNSNLVSNQLINWTLSDNQRRIEVRVGVAYGTNPNTVLDLLKRVALGHPDVLKNPEPLVLFDEFGDSSLNFRLLFWVHFDKGFTTKSDISIGIYNILEENNIEIPFPQVDLNVRKGEEDSKK